MAVAIPSSLWWICCLNHRRSKNKLLPLAIPSSFVVLEPPEIQEQTSGCCHPKLLVVDLLLETKEIQEQTSCSCHPKLRILPSFVSWIIGLESRRLYLVDLHCAIWCAWHRGFCIIRKPSMKPHSLILCLRISHIGTTPTTPSKPSIKQHDSSLKSIGSIHSPSQSQTESNLDSSNIEHSILHAVIVILQRPRCRI